MRPSLLRIIDLDTDPPISEPTSARPDSVRIPVPPRTCPNLSDRMAPCLPADEAPKMRS